MTRQEQQEAIAAADMAGLGHWIEGGDIKTGSLIDPVRFGSHNYGGRGIGKCEYGCGCVMQTCSSYGPVDPFGPCPNNPVK